VVSARNTESENLPSFHDCLLPFEVEYPVQFHSSTANRTGNIVQVT